MSDAKFYMVSIFLISINSIIYEVFQESAYISISNDTNNKRKVLKLYFEAKMSPIKFERYM